MSKYNPNIHHRRSIRLKGYDYSKAGLYFITIVVKKRECLFGNVVGSNVGADVGASPCGYPVPNLDPNPVGANPCPEKADGCPVYEMILNDAGKMIETEWRNLKNRFPNIELHEYIVMPNHFHGILEIVDPPVGVSLVDTPKGQPTVEVSLVDTPNDGQPQVIAPTIAPTISPTSEIAPTISPTNEGQPQGIAPTISPTSETAPTKKTVGDMMDAFKSITTVEYIRGVKSLSWQPFQGKLWQRNYYEHIIRNEQSYENISNYIINNPEKWAEDKFNQ